MKEMVRYGFILGLICIVAAGLLAGVNSLTKTRIIAQAQAEEEASLKEVLPQAIRFEAVKSGEEIVYYKAYDKEGKLIGVAFKASGKGYSSTIETMAGMLKDGTITTIKILSQNETPGLGANVAESSFSSQFKNKKDLDEVQAITGATISSKAVIDSVKKRAEEIKKAIQDEK
jgi:electron transport complex protein RnfG